MWTTISSIFGSKSVIDAGIKGIDSLVLTDEEKIKYHIEFLDRYKPFKLAQRYLAFMFSGVFLLVFLIAVAIRVVAIFIKDLSYAETLLISSNELMKFNIETLGMIVLAIIGWYFAGGVIKLKGSDS